MNLSIVGLIIEIIFLALGVYLYLFARGMIRFGAESTRARSEEFRRENATWMRLLGLALAAIMLLNIVLHLRDLL